MINLISAIYDHAVEQMETIDETIAELNQKIAALQRERDTLDHLYRIAAGYRESNRPSTVSGIVTGDTVNNVPRPTTVQTPYISQNGAQYQTREFTEFTLPTPAIAVVEDQGVQSSRHVTSIF